jgi:DNA recombination protein RmuC
LEHCDFFQQQSTDTEDGRLRPDLIIRLPGHRTIVVDAKAPLEAYLEAIESPDEETRTAKLKEHARQVRNHVTLLGRKSYMDQFEQSPDFVVMFLPGEVFYMAALEHDPGLIEAGVNEKVLVTAPTSLIALLKAAAYGWREKQLTENAKVISQLGQDLYKRLAALVRHLQKLGNGLNTAIVAYNNAIGSFESRVLVSARGFKDLGAGAGTEIEEIKPIETSSRPLQAPELLGANGAEVDDPR